MTQQFKISLPTDVFFFFYEKLWFEQYIKRARKALDQRAVVYILDIRELDTVNSMTLNVYMLTITKVYSILTTM